MLAAVVVAARYGSSAADERKLLHIRPVGSISRRSRLLLLLFSLTKMLSRLSVLAVQWQWVGREWTFCRFSCLCRLQQKPPNICTWPFSRASKLEFYWLTLFGSRR